MASSSSLLLQFRTPLLFLQLLLVSVLLFSGHHSNAASSGLRFLGQTPFTAYTSRSSVIGKVLYQVFAAHISNGGSSGIVYTLVRCNSSCNQFSVNQQTGQITLNAYFPSSEGHLLTVEAQSASLGESQTVDVTVAVISELQAVARFEHSSYQTQVPEDIPVNREFFVVKAFSLSRTDSEYSESYAVAGGTSGELFAIDSRTGIIRVRKNLNREIGDHYILTIQFQYGSRSIFTQLRIEITDVNDNAPIFNQALYHISIWENIPVNSTILTVSAVDPDLGTNGAVSYTLSSSARDQFSLNITSGLMVLSEPLDYETVPLYQFSITASDHGDPSMTSTTVVTINVENVDDECPVFQNDIFVAYHSAGFTGELVRVAAFDPDRLSPVRYSIASASDNGSSFLSIDLNTGAISRAVNASPSTGQYFLNVSASDNGCLMQRFVPVEIRLDGTDNTRPRFQGDCSASLAENPPFNTEVVTLQAVDDDEGFYGRVTYTLLDTDFFSIDPLTGVVRTSRPPASYDRESTQVLRAGVIVRDSGLLQDYCLLTVTLLDENDNAPVFATSSYEAYISVDTPVNMPVLNVSAFDADLDANNKDITYSFTSPSTLFSINSSSGVITPAGPLTVGRYSVPVMAVNPPPLELASYTTIAVSVVSSNTDFPVFSITYYSATVCENDLLLGPILTVTASNSPAYEIVDGQTYDSNRDSVFRLQNNQILRDSNGIINFEQLGSRKSFIFSVRAINVVGLNMVTIEIFVRDADDNPPTVGRTPSFSIAENQPSGTVLGQVLATDPDSGIFGAIAYTLNSPSSNFSVSLDGIITSTRSFDYDRAGEKLQGILQIRTYNPNQAAIDNETDCTSTPQGNTLAVFWIILDQNDEPPQFGRPSYTADIQENHEVGASVLTFEATDRDLGDTSSSLRYSIISGNVNGTFAVAGNMLVLKSRLNSQRLSTYNLVVAVTDGVHYGLLCPDCTASIQIRVADADNTPPYFERPIYSAEISENAAVGTTVVSVSALDPDSSSVGYSISTNVRNLLSISVNGVVTVSGSLDREDYQDGLLSFQVFAESSNLSSSTVNLALLDVNDCAPRFDSIFAGSVTENIAPGRQGVFVVQVHAADPDRGENGTVTYSLESGTEHGFSIDSMSGNITALVEFDREVQSLYHLRVLASDRGQPPLTSTTIVTVEIGDVNDNRPFFPYPFMFVRVFESNGAGNHVFDVPAIDLDDGSNALITYTLVSTTLDQFSLNRSTGALTTSGTLDYENPAHRSSDLVVSIRDQDSSSEVRGTVSVVLLDRNDNPPRLVSATYNTDLGVDHVIHENIAPGPTWATVSVTDDDEGTNGRLVFSILGGNGDFEINNQGEVRTTRFLDYEAVQAYNLTVEVRDEGLPPNMLSVPLNFQVGDINDNVPVFQNPVYQLSVTENDPASLSLIQLRADDPDSGRGGVVDSYRIVSGNAGGVFALNSTTGVFGTIMPLDREVRDGYTIVVSADDNGANPLTGTAEIKVRVEDVDDNPTLGGGVMDVYLYGLNNTLPEVLASSVYFNDPDISNSFTDCLVIDQSSSDFNIDRASCTLLQARPDLQPNEYKVTAFLIPHTNLNTTINIRVSYIDNSDIPESSLITITVNASASDYFTLGLNSTLAGKIAQALGVSRDNLFLVSVQPGFHDPESSIDLTFSARATNGELLSSLAAINTLYLAREGLFVEDYGVVSIPTDPCSGEPCSNQAKCRSTMSVNGVQLAIASRQSVLYSPAVTLGYVCDCVPGTAGPQCEVNYNDCYSNPCQHGVQCTDDVQGFVCDCPQGTFGPDCGFNPDECTSNPCQNGATCVNGFDQYVCSCQPGYYGNRCQYSYFKLSSVCDSSPCQNGGSCSAGRDSFTCLCPNGFDGPQCENQVIVQGGCVGNPCYNGSTCTDTNQGPLCTCSVGFTGPKCRWPLNNCELGLCQNGATCEPGYYGSYRCTCPPGFTGTNCSLRIPACNSNPCENGGRCVDGSDEISFTCQCPSPYSGLRCELNLLPPDLCDEASCSGNCTSGDSAYTCTCPDGFRGRDCSLEEGPFTPCSSNPCQHGGICTTFMSSQNDTGYSCHCSRGFTGRDCEVEMNDCEVSGLCLNGGVCVDGIGGYVCDCIPGVTGISCQIYCPAGREGDFCEDTIQYCNSSSCLNGGTCIERTNGFTCSCPTTHSGPRCEAANMCDSSKCANGGTCVNLGNGGSECLCPRGFVGNSCELLTVSFTGSLSTNSYRAFGTLDHQGQGTVALEFATRQSDGLLLYSSQYQDGQSLDFIAAEIMGGFVRVAMSQGSGQVGVALMSESVKVSDGQWHQLSIQRNGKTLSVLLDECHLLEPGILPLSVCQNSTSSTGNDSFLNLGLPLWLGGVPFASSDYFSSVGFTGCIRNLVIDGRFLDLERYVDQENSNRGCGLADSTCGAVGRAGGVASCGGGNCVPLIGGYMCECLAQKTGENCEESTSSLMFTGSYIRYHLNKVSTGVTRSRRQTSPSTRSTLTDQFSFRFRTESDHGTLFHMGSPSNQSSDYVYVEIASGGILVYHIDLGSGEDTFTLRLGSIPEVTETTTGASERIPSSGINDAEWHFFESIRVALNLTITLDNVTWTWTLGGDQLYLDVGLSDVYVGGTPTGGVASFYVGCIEDVRVDRQVLPTSGSNGYARVEYGDSGHGGGVTMGCSLRGCFPPNPCKTGQCMEVGATDFQCSCRDSITTQSVPCPDPVTMTRFQLVIIISGIVGGLSLLLVIFILIVVCWRLWYNRKHAKMTLQISRYPTNNMILANRDYVDVAEMEDEEGGEIDTAMTGEVWRKHLEIREKDQLTSSSDSTIDKPVWEDEAEVFTNLHVVATENGRPGMGMRRELRENNYTPVPRATSPVIKAHISDRLESLKLMYRDLDECIKYTDEGTDSPAVSLRSHCSYKPDEEPYTLQDLKEAGPEFAKFQVVLETLELEEENVAMDLESEQVHTGLTQTQTQTEAGTLSQSQGDLFFFPNN